MSLKNFIPFMKLKDNNKQEVKKMCSFHGINLNDGAILFELLTKINNKEIKIEKK